MVSINFTSDIYVLKLLSNGNFLWALSFGDYSNDYGKGVSIDHENNVIVNGSFIGTIDFDPSSSVHNLSGLNWSMFILKLDPSGAFIWEKSVGGADNMISASVRTDFSGNVFTTGNYKGTIDFDPGVSVFNLVSNAYADVFEQYLKSYFNSEKIGTNGMPTIEQCGKALNMSGYYLSDLLKLETGKTIKEHIHLKLIDKAKYQLLNSTISVKPLAYELGFEYPQYFNRLFKNKTGVSPSEFRNLN